MRKRGWAAKPTPVSGCTSAGLPQNTQRQRCGNDTTLTETVLHLLEQYERLGDFLEAPAFAPGQPPPGEFRPGELLNKGRFRLIESLFGKQLASN